jgi:hypothetical protein
MHPATCARCGDLMRSPEQIEVRREYRSVRGLRRLRTWRVALICRPCAMREWEHHDHPNGRHEEQGALW